MPFNIPTETEIPKEQKFGEKLLRVVLNVLSNETIKILVLGTGLHNIADHGTIGPRAFLRLAKKYGG